MFRYERPQAGRQRQFNQIRVKSRFNQSSDRCRDYCAGMGLLPELGIEGFDSLYQFLGLYGTGRYRQALVDHFTPLADQLSAGSQRRLTDNPMHGF